MKVIIGIVPACKRNDENPYEYRYSFINNYSKKILKNNALPIGILLNDCKMDEDILNICDGFLFPGGNRLEKFHLEILIHAIKYNKPVLGICLGMQVMVYYDILKKYIDELNMNPKLIERNLNVGFSGGEKKKNEILQMLVLEPKLAILDETDSGLDVDAIKTVSKGISMYKNENNAVLIITHNNRILENLKVDYVHVLVNGKIVKTGDASLAEEIEREGYEKYKKVEE